MEPSLNGIAYTLLPASKKHCVSLGEADAGSAVYGFELPCLPSFQAGDENGMKKYRQAR